MQNPTSYCILHPCSAKIQSSKKINMLPSLPNKIAGGGPSVMCTGTELQFAQGMDVLVTL